MHRFITSTHFEFIMSFKSSGKQTAHETNLFVLVPNCRLKHQSSRVQNLRTRLLLN